MMTRVALIISFTASVVCACSYVPPSPSTCGNGQVNGAEQCDDGNGVDGDGCDSNCTATACGNSIVTGVEECDDGNAAEGDGCTASCQMSTCGDDAIQGNEKCDDGNGVDGDGCDSNCTHTGCGNGVVTGSEVCDDGNTVNGDGCNATCTLKGVSTLFVGKPGERGNKDANGTDATINGGQYMAVSGDALYLGGTQAVRKVDIPTKNVSTVAGIAGEIGYTDADGLAARFSLITGIATDGATIWVADHDNHVIRAISASPPHTVTTVAGVPESNPNAIAPVDGMANSARLGDIRGLAHLNGIVYFMEATAAVLRGFDIQKGTVSTYAGTADVLGDADGYGANAQFRGPKYVTGDGFLALYISDTEGHKIRKYNTVSFGVTTVAGTSACGYVDGNTSNARIHWSRGVAFDRQSVYFAEGGANTIRQAIPTTTSVGTLSGNPEACAFVCTCSSILPGYAEGTPTQAEWSFPYDLAYDAKSGSLFVSDGDNHVIRRIQ